MTILAVASGLGNVDGGRRAASPGILSGEWIPAVQLVEPIPGKEVRGRIVVHVVRSLEIGGTERLVCELVRVQAREGWLPIVACLGERGVLADSIEPLGTCVLALRVLDRGVARGVAALLPWLRRLRPNVVHTHNPGPHLIGAIAARLARVPVVIHTKHGRGCAVSRRRVLASRLASWLTNWVVAVSHDAARVARDAERVPSTKVVTIQNGVNLGAMRQREPGGAGPLVRLIHVARLDNAAKDQVTLLRALRLVADWFPAVTLDIVGDGPDHGMLAGTADALGLHQRVRFLGARGDVADLLRAADLFVLSSVTEGLPMAVLEAMATGLPVVATDVGGNREVVVDGQTGCLVPPRSPQALAWAICGCLRDPVRAWEMGQNGRQRVEGQFDLDSVARQYLQLYTMRG